MPVKNPKILQYAFLSGMYEDPYFPDALVDRARNVLLTLCERIEREAPSGLEALYVLTHAATEEINTLESAFEDAGSEIETAARECFAEDFEFIASAYGFNADYEELTAPRNW